jgi:hypothetical protein
MTSTSSPAQVARTGSCAMDCNQEISSSFGKLTHLVEREKISALSAKTGSMRSRDISHRHQIKKPST